MQVMRSGGATILAKKDDKFVHSIEFDQREHLSVLSCIPNFYILKGFNFLKEYIARCEEGVVINVQPNVWMTRWLFES